jgi:PAS domain S-box-containing protein
LKDVSFELLVASVKDYAIYWLDPQGKIMTWNQGAERIKGYEAADVVGQHFSKFYTPEAIAQRHPDRELELAKQNGRYEEEGPRVRKDGSIFWASVVITALYQDGKHVGFAKVTRDLTERKRAEEAREAAMEQVSEVNRELQHLAYTISHELQQPIASITSSTKLLLTRYKDRWGEDADDFLNEIEKGALMTAKMVDDLWTYARVTKPGGERKIVNLAKLAERTKQELEELISKLNSEVLLIPVNDSPRVECNEKQIAYVIKEMITNAIKHYKGNGKPRLEISIIPERSGWTMNFKDNGVGIDKFFAKQVFAIYQRLNGKPDETGTGMGLPICKKIVESEHHGIIGFENCVDAGTNFYFWLPTGPGNPVCSYLA